MMILFATLLGACWGSFLNMLSWRLVAHTSLWYYRSYCPTCHQHIRWYDMLPIISWFILRGSCRTCTTRISPVYPLIEALAAITGGISILTLNPTDYIWYWPFASTLLITIHTDIRAYRICSWFTLWCIPFSILAATYSITPVSWQESIFAAGLLYIVFAGINTLFWYIKGMNTLGQGDWELIAYIGSVLGIIAGTHVMLAGSIFTLTYAITLSRYYENIQDIPLPFGAGLAAAALFYPLCI